MYQNVIRMAVTSGMRLDHPSGVSQSLDNSPSQLFRYFLNEPPHYLDYTVCMVLFMFCFGEVILMKILLAIAEESLVLGAIRGGRWAQLQLRFPHGFRAAVENSSSGVHQAETENAFQPETIHPAD